MQSLPTEKNFEESEDDQPPDKKILRATDTFPFKITPYLKKLAQQSSAVRRQFYPTPREAQVFPHTQKDPLQEDRFIKVKGLVHKYPQRVLIELTLNCAAYCRFCTRRRKVSDIQRGRLNRADVAKMMTYLQRHKEVNEVIFSGGDPLTAPTLLKEALRQFTQVPTLKIIRLHTRVPVSAPHLITPSLLKILASVKKQPLYLSLHFEHPDELTPPTLAAVKKLRQTGAILMSQTVFLKGINDNHRTLHQLFTRLTEWGVRPYYLYRCDPVQGAAHFIVPLKKEIEIVTRLRQTLSGIAFPLYTIDAPAGAGKIPVPLNFWRFDASQFTDFHHKKIKL
jgi:lysine 2,3-aminomutase